jgi:rod shape-determining protein MreC
VAFAGGGMNTPSARESAPGGRFFFFAILSLVLMYFDQRDGWGERIRYVLQAAAYPIQVTVGSPRRLWEASTELFQTRDALRAENAALLKRDQELSVRTQQFDALQQENARLRGLTSALPPLVSKYLLTDVVNADLGRLRQRLIINQGDRAGLFRSQAMVDTTGLIGQLVRVGPWSAEVMLITDPEAAVPVQVVRNGERTIAVGVGNSRELRLPFLPATADVKAGDLLVTSGLGGIFPAGVPVGKVIENKRDPDALLAQVRVEPAAQLDRTRQVLALWFDPSNPTAPPRPEMLTTLPEPVVADPVVQETAQQRANTAPAASPAAPTAPARATAQPGPRPGVARPAPPRPAATRETPAPVPAPANPESIAPNQDLPAAAQEQPR